MKYRGSCCPHAGRSTPTPFTCNAVDVKSGRPPSLSSDGDTASRWWAAADYGDFGESSGSFLSDSALFPTSAGSGAGSGGVPVSVPAPRPGST
ncbi:hypothetical protein ACIBI9_39000 [Nonomuraea sp. NPDC050451]|uniref:hypothetical protein n=1 Tax=Nonomuraea sp. NPDC050451 TaxID=3364364 RepID=UPI0037B8BB87